MTRHQKGKNITANIALEIVYTPTNPEIDDIMKTVQVDTFSFFLNIQNLKFPLDCVRNLRKLGAYEVPDGMIRKQNWSPWGDYNKSKFILCALLPLLLSCWCKWSLSYIVLVFYDLILHQRPNEWAAIGTNPYYESP